MRDCQRRLLSRKISRIPVVNPQPSVFSKNAVVVVQASGIFLTTEDRRLKTAFKELHA